MKKQIKLGYAGELLVIELEKKRLIDAGESKLADKIEHTSKEKGDGAGYDILSYEIDGTPRHIEVKTTTEDNASPFYMTPTELEFSKRNSETFYLYRLFNFDKDSGEAEYFAIEGDMYSGLNLKPTQYVVKSLL